MINFLKSKLFVYSLIFSVTLTLFSCGSDDEPAPPMGTLSGTITNATTGRELSEANVLVFNADDNAPVETTVTATDGTYSVELEPGNYFIKVSSQGYLSVPAPGLSAVPFIIEDGVTTTQDVQMFESGQTNIGIISGSVTAGGAGVAGILVVAESGSAAFSTISDGDGNYRILNVTSGNFTVKGYGAGYNSDAPTAAVTVDGEAADINVTLTQGASGSLTGQVTNLAAENKDVDVSLVHPITRETIPGLTGFTVNQSYALTEIPDGNYIARATFENDDRVMDPDRIFKFGEPEVTINGGAAEVNFDITGSVQVVAPTNDATTTAPLEITSTTPTFEWSPYSSTSDYVIEVTDANTGQVVWGGFDTSGTLVSKNITIPSSQQSIAFNSDGMASIPALEVGKVYGWRIYASKNDQQSDTGWTLISASENQRGLIKIVE